MEDEGEKELILSGTQGGAVTCAAWIRRREKSVLAIMGRVASGFSSSPAMLEIFSFDSKTASLSDESLVRFAIPGDGGDPLAFAVHPSGDEFVCATANGCKLFKLIYQEFCFRLLFRDIPQLQSVGRQKCLAFSTDGSKFAMGGEDGHLRIFHWPNLNVLLDEPNAHKSFRDMDISLDSEFLVSTSIDGSARIWKIDDGVPLVNLSRTSNEKIECCRFSRDGTKPFLFCTVEKNGKVVTAVWDMSTWSRIGHKKLLGKPASVLSISLDGKYIALGSNDGDFCVAEVKKMEICHWSKKVHLGTRISTIDFCPTERVVISTSNQWGAVVTKLTVPSDWKEWQIYLVLLFLFLASAVLFYVFYEHSDSFWNFPLGRHQPAKPWEAFKDSKLQDDQNPW